MKETNLDSEGYYDKVALGWESLWMKRDPYLRAVERIIIDYVKANKISNIEVLADFGCGPGERAKRISEALNPKKVILIDESSKMCELAQRQSLGEVVNSPIHKISSNFPKINIGLCLWNVLGHLPNLALRIESLKKINSFLDENGIIFLDVNNLHNRRNYNSDWVDSNILKGKESPNDPKLGDVSISFDYNNMRVTSTGHLFSPFEIEEIISSSKLKIIARWVVDYETGALFESHNNGQLLYCLSK